jgi:hypothetical protein
MARRTGVAVEARLETTTLVGPLAFSASSPAASIYRLSVKPTPMWSGRRN